MTNTSTSTSDKGGDVGRSYGRTPCSVWDRNGIFARLSFRAQWLHHMLSTQADISAAGTLPLAVRRWTARAADITPDDLRAWAKELEQAGWLMVDEDTEELWVVHFIAWDKGYNNPKRKPAILDAARVVESPRIRAAVVAELTRFGVRLPDDLANIPPDTASDRQSDSHPDGLSDRQPDTPRDTPPDREPDEVPDTPPPDTTADAGADPAAEPAETKPKRRRGTRLPDDWQPGPELVEWAKAKQVNGVPLLTLVNAKIETEKFRNFWHAKTGAGATKLDWGKTFQNWLLTAAQRSRPPGPTAGRPAAYTNPTDPTDAYKGWK